MNRRETFRSVSMDGVRAGPAVALVAVVGLVALAGCYVEEPAPEAAAPPPAEAAPVTTGVGPGSRGQSHLGKAKGVANATVRQAEEQSRQLEKQFDDQ